jgi:hypothetical protein
MFLLFVINEQDTRSYWESVHSIVAMFDSTSDIPHPLTDFPQFITRVFSLRNVLNPQTVTHSLAFIDKFGFHDSAHFFLYQSPVFLCDPVLYLDTILYLRRRHHKLWTSFVANPKLSDAFLQLYSSFIIPITRPASSRFWQHRILMTEALYAMIEDVFPSHPDILRLSSSFLDSCIPLFQNASYEVGVCLIRPILGLISALTGTMPRDQLQTRMMRLVAILHHSNSAHFLMAVRFAVTIRPIILNHSHVVKLITARGVRCLEDLEVLALMTSESSVINVLSQLVLSAITNHFWMRACFSLIQEILFKFSVKPDVHDCFTVIARRLFLFVALAHLRKKYRARSLCLCECLLSLMQSNAGGFGPVIAGIASAVGARPMPFFFGHLFAISQVCVDDATIHEYELLLGAKLCLKTFPFDPKRKSLALQTIKENGLAKGPPTARAAVRLVKSDSKLPPVPVFVRKSRERPKNRPVQQPLAKLQRPLTQNRPVHFQSETRLPMVNPPF